jgi:hypothetical protein
MLPDELAVPCEHATEVLRPRPVGRTADADVPDPLCSELVRLEWKSKIAVDLPCLEKLDGLTPRLGHDSDVLLETKSDVGHQTGQEDVAAGIQGRHADGLPSQVMDGANPIAAEQFEAASVLAYQDHDGVARFDTEDQRRREVT